MSSEEQVYIWTKQLFRADGWTILASDPPRGTDIPRLEVKEPGGVQSLTKNKNAIINDLVCCKNGTLVLMECKDSSEKTTMDVDKLELLTENRAWRESLRTAMSERSLFNRDGAPSVDAVQDGSALVPALSYPGTPRSGLAQFVQVTFSQGTEDVRIGEGVSPAARESLEGLVP